MTQQVLKKRIMRRVYAIWVLKKMTSPFAMKLLILFAIVRQIFSLVSVSNVIKNSSSLLDPVASSAFMTRAFIHTEISVQILTIATITLSLWLIHDTLFKPGSIQFSEL